MTSTTIWVRFGAAATAAMLAVAGTISSAGAAAATPPYPVVTDAGVAAVTGDMQPAEMSPPGSNVPGCRSSRGTPPVVLLHGTAQNQMSAWQYLAPTLANRGHCVYSLTYGQTSWSAQVGGLGQREKSAKQVAAFVDGVRRATGAAQIDLIGYSQGSAVAQLFTQLPGRAGQVRHLIGLGPSNRGTSKVGSIADRLPARAPGENNWGPKHPSISYLMIVTRHDEVSTP
ncbi:MAG: alpha/beta fold hydrolase, partial [Gordonia sp. (in: high G+C Gram-positive bacteria)]|uniref:esterase/lipase family protein n=1 Tax=Gordonia sp. (in: high G+C Gram-positive bacteria) TaxID=84139 RepID=UPI003BB528EC